MGPVLVVLFPPVSSSLLGFTTVGDRQHTFHITDDPCEEEVGPPTEEPPKPEEHFDMRNDWQRWEKALRNAGKQNQKIAVLVAFLKENRPLEAEAMGRGLYSGMGRFVKTSGTP